MYEDLDIVNDKIDFNTNVINDMTKKVLHLEQEKEDQKNRFEEKSMMQRIKFDDLKKKLKDLQRRSNDCEVLQDEREYQFHSNIDRSNREKEDLANLQMYLLINLIIKIKEN